MFNRASKPGHKPLKSIPFYKITRDNISFYILGSCHQISADVIPEGYDSIIKQAGLIVVEGDKSIKFTLKQLYDFKLLTDHEDPAWFKKLSVKAQEKLARYIHDFLKKHLITEPVPLSKVNPELAHWFVNAGTRPVDNIDHAFEAKFGDRVRYLEGMERYNTLASYRMPINELEYYTTLDTNNSAYQKYLIDYWTNPSKPMKLSVTQRNLKWFNRMLTIIKEYKSPVLFVFGERHLSNAMGILALLRENNFTIEKIDSNGLATPYQAPDYCQESLKLSQLIHAQTSQHIVNKVKFITTVSDKTASLIADYLNFSIFQHPESLSQQVELKQNNDERNIKVYINYN